MRPIILAILVILTLPALAGCLIPGILEDDYAQATIRVDWKANSRSFVLEFRAPEDQADLTFAIYDFTNDRRGAVVESIPGDRMTRESATRYVVSPTVFKALDGRYLTKLFVGNKVVSERPLTVASGHFLDITGVHAQAAYQVTHSYAEKLRPGGDTTFRAIGSADEKSTNFSSRVTFDGSAGAYVLHTEDWVANVSVHDISLIRENGVITKDVLRYTGQWQSRRQFETNGREQDGSGAIRLERTYLGPRTVTLNGADVDAYQSREWSSRTGDLRGPPPRALIEESLTYITKNARTGDVIEFTRETWENSTNTYTIRTGTAADRDFVDPFNALEFRGAAPRELRLGDRFQKSTLSGEVFQFEANKRAERSVIGRTVDAVQVDGRALGGGDVQLLMYVRTAPDTVNERFSLTEGIIAEYREITRVHAYEATIEYRLAAFTVLV